MIAMLLAAQLSAEIARGMPADVVPPPKAGLVRIFPGPGAVVRALPSGSCPGAGRMEASLAKPAALYRHGDRPAKPLLNWTDYPDPRSCLVETGP
jgi:hypothetical protein